MANWVRVIANPKILKRFIKTPAGKRAAFKYGKMALESDITKKAIKRFVDRNGHDIAKDKKYAAQEKQYRELLARMEKLEQEIAQVKDNDAQLQTMTFTLGRNVIEMRQLYAEMVKNLNMIQAQMIQRNVHTK